MAVYCFDRLPKLTLAQFPHVSLKILDSFCLHILATIQYCCCFPAHRTLTIHASLSLLLMIVVIGCISVVIKEDKQADNLLQQTGQTTTTTSNAATAISCHTSGSDGCAC
jgi:hypothetical protein